MTTTATHSLPMLLGEVVVTRVERLSPSYQRIELGGELLADFGVAGHLYDQRIKLVFPPAGGQLPSFEGADETWFSTWLERPVAERGSMRTYTIRSVRGAGAQTRIVVDFVLHPGDSGPGSSWAAAAGPGDRLVILAPRRGMPFGGIEFAPPAQARSLLLAGDETAVPAISSILEDLPDGTSGSAFLEVPTHGDVLDVRCPIGMEVVWLPRHDAPLGQQLQAAVLGQLGGGRLPLVEPDEVDPDLWETATYSSSGESLDPVPEDEHAGLYAWIAGESGMVTGLRRALVNELGVDRRQVAFMGYWRRGVAMRS